jgi:hypothetical protein
MISNFASTAPDEYNMVACMRLPLLRRTCGCTIYQTPQLMLLVEHFRMVKEASNQSRSFDHGVVTTNPTAIFQSCSVNCRRQQILTWRRQRQLRSNVITNSKSFAIHIPPEPFTIFEFNNTYRFIECPIEAAPFTDNTTTQFLEDVRKNATVRIFWYYLKTLLNDRAAPFEENFFNSFIDEDFGDTVAIDPSLPSFHSCRFDWENFRGPSGQLLGFSKEEKKAIVLSVSHYPKISSAIHPSPSVLALREEFEISTPPVKKRKRGENHDILVTKKQVDKAHCKTYCTRATLGGKRAQVIGTTILQDTNSENLRQVSQFSHYIIGPQVYYRKRRPAVDCTRIVPSAVYCCPVGKKASKCRCRYLIFNENSFVTMLLPMLMLVNVTVTLQKCKDIKKAADYFNAVFGVTCVPSHVCTNGV